LPSSARLELAAPQDLPSSTLARLSAPCRWRDDLTICNMSIEAGARIGMIGPDETTFSFLHGRRYAPKGGEWERALAYWQALPTDSDARFDREVSFDAARLAPMVSWGTSPEDCSPVDGMVPDPSEIGDGDRRRHVERALDYMKLTPATPLQQVTIDRVFIGSCTNSRIEDLRAAAKVLEGRKARVPGMVSPGSHGVKRQAEAEGLHQIFLDAGLGVARTRLLHVQRFERRAGCPGGTLRFDHQSQLSKVVRAVGRSLIS